MKTLRKIIIYSNIAVAATLLLTYLIPYLPPHRIGNLSVLALITPALFRANILFALYWMFRYKGWVWLSVGVLILGFGYLKLWVQPLKLHPDTDESIKVLSFNARLFNHYHWHKDLQLPEKINHFFDKENPDVILLQEFYNNQRYYPKNYPYKSIIVKQKSDKIGLAIFSKFKILKAGSLKFENTTNNAMYADLLIGNDTLRFYNMHLESLHLSTDDDNQMHISTNDNNFQRPDKEKEALVENISKRFEKQEDQVQLFIEHKAYSPHKTIVCGDFNNTAYSYIYRRVRGNDLNDAFEQAGKGFGRTYNFHYFPMRIDFILPHKSLKVIHFQTHYLELSDHFPLTATFKLAND